LKKANLDPTEEISIFTPDYVRIGVLMNAAGINPTEYDFAGLKLLELRRKAQPLDHNIFAGDDFDGAARMEGFVRGVESLFSTTDIGTASQP